MLARLQRRITELYDLELAVDVEDFLCDEETARSLGGEDATRRGEVLFVVEEEDGARVALFVDARDRRRFSGWCRAAEGVSHFVYVAFRADHALEVSELELELQAEIDKWALGLFGSGGAALAGRGAGLVALRDRSRRLRARLFARAAYLDEEGTERGDRYRDAVRFASRYAQALETEHVARGRMDELSRELRRFYRLGLREKLERIA
jgi:hypothetical protein